MPTDPVSLVLAAVLGSMFGSFLNVLILRLPHEESVVRPGSRCPRCGTPIAWYDNIPVLSWIALRGKCRRCRTPISVQYPLIELVTAGVWLGSAWYYGVSLEGLAAAVFGTILLGIAITDARHYLIPDEYTWGGLVLGLALSLRGGAAGLFWAVFGAAVGFGLLYLVAVGGEKVFKREAMGGGDIKMMAMVGSFVGWQGVLLTVFVGSLLGTIGWLPLGFAAWVGLLARRRRVVPFGTFRRYFNLFFKVPFGVFLAAAAVPVFLFGREFIEWYLRFATGG